MNIDINGLGSPPLFEVVPYIHDTKKAAVHIKGGDFQEVVFIVDKVKMDEEEQEEGQLEPFFEVNFKVVEWDERIFPGVTSEDFDGDENFQMEVARIMNVMLMSSLARALEERHAAGKDADKSLRQILREKGVDVNEPRARESENAEPDREDDLGSDRTQ